MEVIGCATFSPKAGRRALTSYLRFSLVGLSGVAVDSAVLYACASTTGLGWNVSIAKIVASESAILNNFYWNDIWTFKGGPSFLDSAQGRFFRFAKFNAACFVGILLNVLLLNLQIRWLGINLYLANLISIVLVSAINFFFCSRKVWKPGHSQEVTLH